MQIWRQCYRPTPLPYIGSRYIVTSQRRLLAGKPQGTEYVAFGQRSTTEDDDYEGALKILNRYQSQARKFPSHSLQLKRETPRERTKNWLRLLGHDVDHARHKVIHVAGTKGKGTTCRYCSGILVGHQKITGEPKKIGCLTSPHQMDVRERILINNQKISKRLFSDSVRELDSKLNSLSSRLDLEIPGTPLFPGFITLLAMLFFDSQSVDVAILETGVGGETDSTNVFPHPIATGITTIGLDHVDVLGKTVEEIAWHKAGIFKAGSLAGTVPQSEPVLRVLRKRAEEKHVAGELQVITDRRVLDYGVKVEPNMLYQRQNAGLAMFLAEAYLKSEDLHFTMTGEHARSLQDVELLGISQVLKDGDITWFVSSGHNEISLKETVSWFKQSIRQTGIPRVLMFNQGFSRSSHRDPYLLLKVIHENLSADDTVALQGVIFCTDQLSESGKENLDLIDFRNVVSSLQNQEENARIWEGLGGSGQIEVVHTIRDAVHLVRKKYKGSEVLVTGSSYLAGNILHVL